MADGFPGRVTGDAAGKWPTPSVKRITRVEDLRAFDDTEILDAFLAEAAWFWFDASTSEMKLEAGLHRLIALCLAEEVRRRGLAEPDPDQVYARARRAFPPDDLRPRRESDYRSFQNTSDLKYWTPSWRRPPGSGSTPARRR